VNKAKKKKTCETNKRKKRENNLVYCHRSLYFAQSGHQLTDKIGSDTNMYVFPFLLSVNEKIVKDN